MTQKEKSPAKEQITLRLPAELLDELRAEADDQGISFNGYIMIILSNRSV